MRKYELILPSELLHVAVSFVPWRRTMDEKSKADQTVKRIYAL